MALTSEKTFSTRKKVHPIVLSIQNRKLTCSIGPKTAFNIYFQYVLKQICQFNEWLREFKLGLNTLSKSTTANYTYSPCLTNNS